MKIGVEVDESGQQEWHAFHPTCVPDEFYGWFGLSLPKEPATSPAAAAAPETAEMDSDEPPAPVLEIANSGARCRVVIVRGSRSLCRTLA